MASTNEPAAPPSFRLTTKFLARGYWAAAAREILAVIGVQSAPSDYARWRQLHRLTSRDRARIRKQIAAWKNPPTISIVGKSDIRAKTQLYPPFEIVSDVGAATGDFICFLDPGDALPDHALFKIAQAIIADPSRDMIYSDEDAPSETGPDVRPFFKPDWSPEYFLAFPYIGRLAVYRRHLVNQIGGVRPQFGDAFEYDLILRLFAAGAKIHHIPDILCHRKFAPVVDADSARRAVQDYLDSTNQSAVVEPGPSPATHRVRFALRSNPLVSIVIPSACRRIVFRDRPSWFVLECVASIRRLSTYKNIEIIVLDNNDMPADLAAALQPLDIRKIPFTEPFNLTRKINLGASHARGEQLLLMNDDIEIITPDWIEAMLEFSQQPAIGAVGAQLLFPDDTQQHTGVVIQNGNPRHPFYHAPADHPGYFHSSQVHRNYSAVTGACTMTRKEVFDAVGGYSERFALSYNDIDFCLKIRELGKRIVYTPYAKMYHHESVSRPLTRPDHVNAFKEFWLPRFPLDPCYNPNLTRHFRIKLP
jgi:GT2 family glycosyltransferase